MVLNESFGRMNAARERVTRFTADASHELRTPVTAIGLIAELLSADTKDPSAFGNETVAPKLRERILQLESESIHLGQMINELLDLARIESGEGMHRNDEIALDALVRGAVDRLSPFAAQANVTVTVESTGAAKLASRGNMARLTQVVVNLLHNAIKFSSPGDAVLVQVLAPTVDQPEAKIVITDRGTGIAREDVNRVFERFFSHRIVDPLREVASVVRAFDGSGEVLVECVEHYRIV